MNLSLNTKTKYNNAQHWLWEEEADPFATAPKISQSQTRAHALPRLIHFPQNPRPETFVSPNADDRSILSELMAPRGAGIFQLADRELYCSRGLTTAGPRRGVDDDRLPFSCSSFRRRFTLDAPGAGSLIVRDDDGINEFRGFRGSRSVLQFPTYTDVFRFQRVFF